MIPNLTELAQELGIRAVFVPFVLVALLTGLVLLVQSIALWLSDRDS